MRAFLRSFPIIAALAIAACAGSRTNIEVSWTAPQAHAEQLHHVVALFLSRDGALRRAAEDHMARDLAARGVAATPAYRVLAPSDARNLEGAKAKLRMLGYDGVVAMRIVSREHKLQYVPADFDAYWGWASPFLYDYTYTPGYAYTQTIVRVETSAYSLNTNQLVWSALSRTTDPRNAQSLIDSVVGIAAERLVRQGIAV